MAAVTICSDFGAPPKIKVWHCFVAWWGKTLLHHAAFPVCLLLSFSAAPLSLLWSHFLPASFPFLSPTMYLAAPHTPHVCLVTLFPHLYTVFLSVSFPVILYQPLFKSICLCEVSLVMQWLSSPSWRMWERSTSFLWHWHFSVIPLVSLSLSHTHTYTQTHTFTLAFYLKGDVLSEGRQI